MVLFWPAVLSLVLVLSPGAEGFGILPGDSLNHLEITEAALLNATVYTCRAVAQAELTDFTFPAQPYTVESVAKACGATPSAKTFSKAITDIIIRNVRVDIRHALNGSFHFDDEMFTGGRKIITTEILSIKANNKNESYEAARESLGKALHPLQDYYSHSNWVELGYTVPNVNLIRSDTSIGNIAAPTRATCRSCNDDDCRNNILEDIIREKVITSGYFSLAIIGASKPPGKCSHGGKVDLTSTIEPKGGINKDSLTSSHGHLHTQAANLAITATSHLLEDIRGAAGDKQFLLMMGISKGSSKALCFVIDVSKSMSDEIDAVKTVTSNIVNTEVGTDNEPSVYILVPFSDPDVGPLTKTTDPNAFKTAIDNLSPSGGGDVPEKSLSGLQLGLTTAPSNSEIFLFTDAPASDQHLKSTLIALIERTQTVVNFLITDSVNTNRRRRSTSQISAADVQVYRDLAQTSGGQAIEVSKFELSAATSIITEASINSMVTLLQSARSAGVTETFSFIVDRSMTKVIVYMTGSSISFTLTSPSGQTQSSTSGPLIESSELVGNFQTLRLDVQWGEWKLRLSSPNIYTVKVIGQSPIDFLVDFVEASQGPFGGYDTLETRPKVGVEGFIVVTLTGSSSATLTVVDLVEAKGSNTVSGAIQAQERNYLVKFATIPAGQFVVRVKGTEGPSVFQRQSPTTFTASNLTISATADSLLTPGTPFVVPFTITTSEVGVNITIRVTNNRGFDSTFPTSLVIESGNSTNGTVTLSAPLNTPSGSDVTLTIEAETPEGDDNYVVQRFSVFNTVTDFSAPVCELLSLQSNCSSVNCSQYMWSFSARISDGADGTGVERVTLKEGNGTFTTNPDPQNAKSTLVSYSSSCCSPSMQMLAVDKVGNVATCTISYNNIVTSPLSLAPKITQPNFVLFLISLTFVFFTLTK